MLSTTSPSSFLLFVGCSERFPTFPLFCWRCRSFSVGLQLMCGVWVCDLCTGEWKRGREREKQSCHLISGSGAPLFLCTLSIVWSAAAAALAANWHSLTDMLLMLSRNIVGTDYCCCLLLHSRRHLLMRLLLLSIGREEVRAWASEWVRDEMRWAHILTHTHTASANCSARFSRLIAIQCS